MPDLLPGWLPWCDMCAEAQSTQELQELLELFLTDEERAAIAGRYRVIQALLLGKESQRQIAASQGVSIATITRGSNQLKRIDPKLKSILLSYFKNQDG